MLQSISISNACYILWTFYSPKNPDLNYWVKLIATINIRMNLQDYSAHLWPIVYIYHLASCIQGSRSEWLLAELLHHKYPSSDPPSQPRVGTAGRTGVLYGTVPEREQTGTYKASNTDQTHSHSLSHTKSHAHFKYDCSLKNENPVINLSPSCHSKNMFLFILFK